MRIKLTITLYVIIVFTLDAYSHTGRNIFTVYVNSNDLVLAEGKIVGMSELNSMLQLYLTNPNDDYSLPEKREKEILGLGPCEVSRVVVSILCSCETTYKAFIDVLNAFEKAYVEARNYYAMKYFSTEYSQLPYEKQQMIRKVCPKVISEAEPLFVLRGGELVENNFWDYCW